jgi:hypothetical protein
VTDDDGLIRLRKAAVTGDMLEKEHGPFDLIKIDVEGFELDVLQGVKVLSCPLQKLRSKFTWKGFGPGANPSPIFPA